MRSYGIMQGRLTPQNGRGIQFFPFENWKKEFDIGSKIGINEIEWIFDYDRYEENPLWTQNGQKQLVETISNTGVIVNSICFDYFMRRPFYKADKESTKQLRNENVDFIKRILDGMNEIGANLLEIPMVDNSSISNSEEKKIAIDFLQDILVIAEHNNIIIGCETDMPVGVFRDFLMKINNPRIKANYDSGNSSGLGYNHYDEIHSLAELIANVHIKDRVLHGTTVALGTGSANFDEVFSSLKDIDYKGSIILQAARGSENDEKNNITNQLQFVKKYCQKYELE